MDDKGVRIGTLVVVVKDENPRLLGEIVAGRIGSDGGVNILVLSTFERDMQGDIGKVKAFNRKEVVLVEEFLHKTSMLFDLFRMAMPANLDDLQESGAVIAGEICIGTISSVIAVGEGCARGFVIDELLGKSTIFAPSGVVNVADIFDDTEGE